MRLLFLSLLLCDLAFASTPVLVPLPAQTGQVSVTDFVPRQRRRHENDMDFSKYNPFYWQGRGTTVKIEDFTSAGKKRLTVTLTTEWPQNYIPTRGPDFSAVYTGDPLGRDETLRSKFLFNIRMTHVRDSRVFTATLDEGAFNAAGEAMKPGKILTMEVRFFLDESFPDWKKQKQANGHNLSAYYSEFVRIKLGEPGLKIDHPTQANGEASPERYSGGSMTTVTTRVEPWKALEQAATNLRAENAQAFLFGRAWAHTDFTTGQHVGEVSDDKPSLFFEGDRAYRAGYQGTAYNVQGACVSCHLNNGSALLGSGRTDTTILRTADSRDLTAHKAFGSQVQTSGAKAEGTVSVRWEYSKEAFSDGESVELRKPIFDILSGLDKSNLGTSPRRPLPWVALGLIEAIPDDTIRGYAKDNGGTVSNDEWRVGRFGHKAERATIEDQVQSAMTTDLGVQTEKFSMLDCSNGCKGGKGKLFQPAIDDITTYLALLGPPPRMNPEGHGIMRGGLTFRKIGCAKCHIPSARTGGHRFTELMNQDVQLFSDFLLHDMGEGLKDSMGGKLSSMWRTAPLIGFAAKRASTDSRPNQFRPGDISILWSSAWDAVRSNRIDMLHDGRARTLQEAVMWHAGEAEASRQEYKKLPKEDRADLHSFLEDI